MWRIGTGTGSSSTTSSSPSATPEASRKVFYRTVLAALDIPPLWEGEHGGQYANLVVGASQAAPGTTDTHRFRRPQIAR